MLIAHISDIRKLKKSDVFKWAYIGTHKGSVFAEKVLDPLKRVFIAKDMDTVIELIRENFVDYIGKISNYQENKLVWYSSPLASKSICQTSIFRQYVYQKLMTKIAKDNNDAILVITDDNEFLSNTLCIKPQGIKILSTNTIPRLLRRLYKVIKGYAEIIKYVFLWAMYKFFRNQRVSQFDIFIHTWIDERNFSNIPEFNDPYFSRLSQFLEEKNLLVARLTELNVGLKYIYRLQKHFKNIVMPFSCITFKDLLRAIYTAFLVKLPDNDLPGIDDLQLLNTLTRNEAKKEAQLKNYLYYLLMFYSYKNFATRIKPKASFIYPFENQPWEKMLNMALPGYERIGYQHTTIPSNWLDYRVSQYEGNPPLPTTILTSGKIWTRFLKKYYRDIEIEEAGALRYSNLFASRDAKPQLSGRKNIVVALPITTTIALPMQELLCDYLRRNSLLDYDVKIKRHPFLPSSGYLKSLFSIFPNCSYVDDPISFLLKNCSLFIAYDSSVLFEAVALRVKTLCFIPEDISFGILHHVKNSVYVAYEENFAEKFEEALKSSIYPQLDIEEYFSAPDYDKFLKYTQICS